MTETRWLDFAGFLNGCIFGLENNDCPFNKFHQLDQYQKLESLLNISERKATGMINCCEQHKENCKTPFQKHTLKSLELELIP